jgi:hypothetical protein
MYTRKLIVLSLYRRHLHELSNDLRRYNILQPRNGFVRSSVLHDAEVATDRGLS